MRENWTYTEYIIMMNGDDGYECVYPDAYQMQSCSRRGIHTHTTILYLLSLLLVSDGISEKQSCVQKHGEVVHLCNAVFIQCYVLH